MDRRGRFQPKEEEMQAPTEVIRTAELSSTSRRQHATSRLQLRQLLSAFAAWWADDSMSSRFDQERARDEQMARRNAW
jgi:hypothetical protein